jgi:hypothetical protein
MMPLLIRIWVGFNSPMIRVVISPVPIASGTPRNGGGPRSPSLTPTMLGYVPKGPLRGLGVSGRGNRFRIYSKGIPPLRSG